MTRNRSANPSKEGALSGTRPKRRSAQTESTNSFAAIITILLGLVGSYLGCDLVNPKNRSADPNYDSNTIPTSTGQPTIANGSQGTPNLGAVIQNPNSTGAVGNSVPGTSGFERDSILLGSFNIQSLGQSKMNRPEVVQTIAATILKFDILAVQELRDKSERTIPAILELVNSNGARYEAVVSPRLRYGNNNYFEQLVYFYDSTQIEILTEPYVAPDPKRLMHRQPFVAHFRYRSRYPQDAFSFILMNVHTDPDQTRIEFQALEEIIPGVQANHPAEDDVILLGDLNEEPIGFVRYRLFNDQWSAVPSHWKTNTRETENYDNFVFDKSRTSEFLGNAGVLNLKTYFGLSFQQALAVSDHMPVWAEFSTRETRSGLLTQQPGDIR